MSVTVSVNNATYTIPQTNETGWGAAVTSWIQAISASTLQLNGGSFPLTANVNFGSTYGLTANYFTSTANINVGALLILANGAAATPSLVFTGAQTSGLSWVGGAIRASYAATEKFQWSAAGLTMSSGQFQLTHTGTASAPDLCFDNALTTGIYATGTNQLALAANGALALQFGTNQVATFGSEVKFPTSLTGTDISTPTNPSGGSHKLYFKSGGLYMLTSAGAESQFAAVAAQRSSVIGNTPGTGVAGWGDTTGTKIRRWTNTTTTGTDLTYADDQHLGMTITVNTTGLYGFSWSDNYSGGNFQIGWSVNSNQLTTSIESITTAHRLICGGGAATTIPCITTVALLTAGDILRTHGQGNCDATSAQFQFRIVKLND